MYHKYTGIILKKHPLGEADELLTIYTKEAGKMRVRVISSRKIKSRLSGNLQTLNEIEFETAGSGSLPILISACARTVNSFLRGNLKKFALVLVGIETLYRLTPDRQENADAYQALVDFLQELRREDGQEKLMIRSFQLKLLRIFGYGFAVSRNTSGQAQTLSPKEQAELTALWDGSYPKTLSWKVEQVIDNFLNYILEREIKSSRFLQEVNEET